LERGYVNDRNALKAFKKVFENVLHPSVRDDDEKLTALLREYLKEMDKYYVEIPSKPVGPPLRDHKEGDVPPKPEGWDGSKITKTDIFGQTWVTG
jgi:hypothetical protein